MRWLRSELIRLWISLTLAVVLGIPASMGFLQLAPPPPHAEAWAGGLVFWTVFTLIQAGLSFLTYRGLPSEELRTALGQGRREHGILGTITRIPGARMFLGISDAPSYGRQVAFVALLGVGAILLIGELRELPLLRILSALVVVASWINLLITYTVHYARLHAQDNAGLAFPAGGGRTLPDYLYFSIAVQTTFGTTDVTVTTTKMRRTVTGHAALAFLFNTVILALTISILAA
ncbi:MAG: DUF1345 domain-containing protein [Actinomycetia bacterium]|nr:DUF1345 domain-containing protein [Actinomycetes bacterium]